jgi:dTDP-4-amino-4,6-dideoxygalactose transaminase
MPSEASRRQAIDTRVDVGVPFVDLSRHHAELRDELEAAFRSVVASGQFVFGPELMAFEEEWADYCEAPYAVGVASGTAAIQLVLEALGIGPSDEVIIPANTFISTAIPKLQRSTSTRRGQPLRSTRAR